MEEVVRRWVNEIQEATSSKHAMVQFHALALLYELKKNDRLALHKVSKTLQQDVKIAAFWENPENIWSKFSKNSAKFWQNILKKISKQFSNFNEKIEIRERCKTVQRSALCRSRRELSNEYLLAKIGVDTAENEPLEV